MIRILLPVLTFLGLLAFPAFGAPLAPDQVIKLPNGHSITILSISKIEGSKGVMALMVRYQTSLSIDQRKALSDEVDDFWKVAIKDVEHDGFREAVISSNEIPHGIIFHASRMMDFVYDKGSDGKWVRFGRSDFVAAQ